MVSNETYTKLEAMSDQSGRTLEDLQNRMYDILKNIQESVSEEQREKVALNRLRTELRKGKIRETNLIRLEGFVTGATEAADIVDRMKAKIDREFQSKAEKLIAGAINEQDQVLDRNPTFKDGRTNPNYGKPMKARKTRTFYGFGRLVDNGTTGDWKEFRMEASFKLADKFPYKPYAPMIFLANQKQSLNPQEFLLQATTVQNKIHFEKSSLTDQDIEKVIKEVGLTIAPTQVALESFHKKNLKNYDRRVFVKGVVGTLNLEPRGDSGSRAMRLLTETEDLGEKGVAAYIPPFVDINFGEGSIIYAQVRTSQSKRTQEYSGNVLGVFAPPEWRISMPVQQIQGDIEITWED